MEEHTMTNQQKQRVMEMRVDGKTYREIAEELGVTLGCVKMFMSRYRRQGERKRCVLCNKYLPQNARSTQRFCSVRCKTE
jgi:transposase